MTFEEAQECRDLYAQGWAQVALAERYGHSAHYISTVLAQLHHRPRNAPAGTSKQDWRNDAMCRGEETALFFTDGTARAKSLCTGCPVRRACLEHALEWPERDGVWGGLDERERRRLVRNRARRIDPTQDPLPLDRIRALRRLGWTDREVAEKLGTYREAIGRVAGPRAT